MPTNEEALELFNQNTEIAHIQCARYKAWFTRCNEVSKDDLLQICLIGLWDAARKFRPDRGASFSTWAYARIYNRIIDAYRDAMGQRDYPLESIEAFSEGTPASDDPAAEACSNVQYQAFLESLPMNTQTVLKLSARGYLQKEIAAMRGVSCPRVSTILHHQAERYARTALM